MKRLGKILRNAFAGILAAALTVPTVVASVRGPGKYNGVVFFDRWDNCYLFSGVYLMYISESVKEALRPYRGRSVEIDAKEVHQLVNPGDGLIKRFVVIGESKDNPRLPSVAGVQLRSAVSRVNGDLKAMIEILNTDPEAITIQPDALGYAVIAYGSPENYFGLCPSDGTSCAMITRADVTLPDGDARIGDLRWGWRIESRDRLLKTFTLQSGERGKTSIVIRLPPGNYQFLAGYGGGVHAGPCVMSNAVSFDVDRH